jgi:TrmH family RNA methyltransferase
MQTASNRTLTRIVQSRQNRRVKELRAGLARGIKSDQGRIALEGEHLLEEALRSGLRVETIFVRSGSEGVLARLRERFAIQITKSPEFEILQLTPDVFASAVVTESPQGVAALVEAPAFSWGELLHAPNPLLMVCAGLQDPGNLGTLIRSAEAFGAAGMVILPGTVSPWNAKALRASAGSAFRLPVVAASPEEAFTFLRKNHIPLLAAVAAGGISGTEMDLSGPAALLIGNEGSGLPEEWIARADQRVTIPCPGPVESLNAAVAGSVLLYEAARQRGVAAKPASMRPIGAGQP